MPTFTFPAKHLKAVQDGTKTLTQRISHTLHRAKPGDVAVLQFGKRDAPTTLRTTITEVEVLDYIAFRDRLLETGDPRGELEPEDLHAAILASGTPEERRLLEVAQASGMSVEEMIVDMDDATQEAVDAYSERKKIIPALLSDVEVDDLYAKHQKRIVIVHFAPPA